MSNAQFTKKKINMTQIGFKSALMQRIVITTNHSLMIVLTVMHGNLVLKLL